MQEHIIFEQPLNELTRVYLKLEYLFHQLNKHLNNFEQYETELTMEVLLEIICVLDRPDLKSKLTQELHRIIAQFSKLKQSPDVDITSLDKQLKQLETHLHYLTQLDGKLGQALKEDAFLTDIRLNFNTPGYRSCIDMPAYHYWLNLPSKVHTKQFNAWYETLKPIEKIVTDLLNIIRHSGRSKSLTAEDGFHHESLPAAPACQLIRLTLNPKLEIFPEISAGKHRVVIRLVKATSREQAKEAVSLELQCCCV